ncbi:Protein of unknown function [Pyronema omphalodes CBS 100304]|uniref:Uncharacterized protein n=1 Tax=Pyronema omphalodes (strain CBS 100304) TaxID=1076935 RepID=U4KYE3_PYROM|nr:Protein of unknown function [Pyronema omphalodes CBS 100304]
MCMTANQRKENISNYNDLFLFFQLWRLE